MSNSPLVTYTRISPHSNPRNHPIDTISIHCVVGQATAKQICDLERFAVADADDDDASCNYAVGTDGSIGLCVEESRRSWCTSSRSNDHRAITIEVASDTKHPYAVNSRAYAALINLLVDICQRNGKSKLLWFADKEKTLAYDPAPGEMVMTVHRWFAAKACPGDYLYQRHGQIAAEVNARLAPAASATPAPTAVSEQAMWDFLKASGLNDFGAAGAMGNLYAESGLKATNLQQTYEKKLGHTDASYTAAVDAGTYGNFVNDKAGYGLAQWTFWSRKQGLLNYAKAQGKSIGDALMQLGFFLKELQESFPSTLRVLKYAKSVREASDAMLLKYERPADQSEAVQIKRAGFSQIFYDKYAGKEEPEVDLAQFKKLWYEMRAELQDNDSNAYSEAARQWAVKTGLIAGGDKLPDGTPNYMWADIPTREQLVTVLYRFAQLIGKA